MNTPPPATPPANLYETPAEFRAALPAGEGRLAGLDYGEARIGVALTDPLRMIASPLSIYERRTTRQDIGYIADLLRKHAAAGWVCGWPLEHTGEAGERCAAVLRFCRKVQEKLGDAPPPLLLLDERYTSLQASRALKETNRGRDKDDAAAASLLLSAVL